MFSFGFGTIFILISDPFHWVSDLENEIVLLTFRSNSDQMKTEELKKSPSSSIILQPVWDKILRFFIDATGSMFEQICKMQVSI